MSVIRPGDIQAAIVARLSQAFPGEKIYEDLTPRDFVRPSCLVEPAGLALDPLSGGHGTVRLTGKWKITSFAVVDEVHNSHLPELTWRAMAVMSAFAAGWLQVGDRAPKITRLEADTSCYDCAPVEMTLELSLDRRDFDPEEVCQLMQQFHLKLSERTE